MKAKGRKIYSNYATPFTDERVFSLEALDRMRMGFFAWDDAYIWANSRRFKDNKGVDIILGKSGKRKIDIAWTTTRTSQVDINIRYNTSVAIIPEIILNPQTKVPELMIARFFEFMPEGQNEMEQLGMLFNKMVVRGNLLKRVMGWYDTAEEIEELESG
jgi:hypothetical protein